MLCIIIGITTVAIFSLPERRSQRAIVLPLVSALALASVLASANINIFLKVFLDLIFPNFITNLIHLWYDYTSWSKILCSTIPFILGHVKVKVKVTDLEFSC